MTMSLWLPLFLLSLLPKVVDARGCFLAETRVTLPGGLRREIPISEVREGMEVLSFDQEMQARTTSIVSHVLHFTVNSSDLVTINLGHAQPRVLHVTQDHPIFSTLQNSLVSFRPGQTFESYHLQTKLFAPREMLEGTEGEMVPATLDPNQNMTHTRPQNVTRTPAQNTTLFVGVTDVFTLELEGNHWFYAEGVRVHNKGRRSGGSSSRSRSGGSSYYRRHYYYSRGNSWSSYNCSKAGSCKLVEGAKYGLAAVVAGVILSCCYCRWQKNKTGSCPAVRECIEMGHCHVSKTARERGYDDGWICDNCDGEHSLGVPFFHCETCEVDFCDKCEGKLTGRPKHELESAHAAKQQQGGAPGQTANRDYMY